MKYLVVVNPQNDYLDGALSNKEACAIIGGICDKIVEYENNNWPIFVVYDKRDEDYLTTYESKKIPIVHCVQGTEGYELNKFIKLALNHKRDYDRLLYVEKLSTGPSMLAPEMWTVAQFLGLPDEIEIVGTRTDTDILYTAILVKSEFRERLVSVDAMLCAGTTPYKHNIALAAMECAHIEVKNNGKEVWLDEV